MAAFVCVCSYLCHAAEPRVGFGGADLQGVQVVSALVVDGPGEAESAALLVDAEQIPMIHQQHVGQTLLLEGDGLNHGHAAETHCERSVSNTVDSLFFSDRHDLFHCHSLSQQRLERKKICTMKRFHLYSSQPDAKQEVSHL